jgi:hypothetical protein
MSDAQYCTEEHAQQQAEMIRQYWSKRNVDVEVWIEAHTTGRRGGGAIYNVRSDIKLEVVRRNRAQPDHIEPPCDVEAKP